MDSGYAMSFKIALYHGYLLGGSGSEEYTRYLARTLARLGTEVVIICDDRHPERLGFVSRAVAYDRSGAATELFSRQPEDPQTAPVSVHQLPRVSVYPVFLTDKQREGVVKSFPELTEAELAEYHAAMVATVKAVLAAEKPDILHCNHLVYQPTVAAEACAETGTPYTVVPHGSSIEYTINKDRRYFDLARAGLEKADGIAWIARELRSRVLEQLYPEIRSELEAKSHMVGIGTDTSLFKPLARADRRATLGEMAKMFRPGGKTAVQRAELRAALDAGDVDATGRYWDAYDHKVEDADLPELLDRIPVGTEADVLFFVGAMTYGKGIHSIIAAMPGILARRRDTHLVLVGSGTYREVLEALTHALASGNLDLFDRLVARGRDLERQVMDGPLEDLQAYAANEKYRNLLREHGPMLAERVHFLGRLDHPRLRCIFGCADVGVFPSVVKEASPLVFLEALSNGVVPAGSYHSGLREGLDELRAYLPGELWEHMKLPTEPATRVAGIAENLATLLAAVREHDPSSYLRSLAVSRYDWTAVAEKMLSISKTILEGRAAS